LPEDKVLRCCLKIVSDGVEVRCVGRLFQRLAWRLERPACQQQ